MRFAVKVSLNTVGLAADLATMATGGAAPLGVVMAGVKMATLAAAVAAYAQGRDKLAKQVMENDRKLAEARAPHKVAGGKSSASMVGREVGAPLGLGRLVASVRLQRETLEEFDARTARMRRDLRKTYAEAEKQRSNIEAQFNGADLSPEELAQLERAGEAHSQLMDSVVDMMKTLDADDKLLKEYSARCEAYATHHPPGTDATAEFVDNATQIRRVGSVASSIATLMSTASTAVL
jgi:hypothetical protein